MSRLLARGLFGSCLVVVFGCASMQEATKNLLGVSTRTLEEKRTEAVVLKINKDYFTCYQKVLDGLGESGGYIYAKKPDLIAFYLSESDTTPVGVFFKDIDKEKTQLEISSPSSLGREKIAKDILALFEKEVTVTPF